MKRGIFRKVIPMAFMIITMAAGCGEERGMVRSESVDAQPHSATTFAMDTVIEFLAVYHEDGEQVIIEAEQEIHRLERLFSVTLDESEIAVMNAQAGRAPVAASEDTQRLIQKAVEMHDLTRGAFDITISPVVQAWGFTTDGQNQIPTDEALMAVMDLVCIDDILIDTEKQTITLTREGMAMDLGGIAKGFASDAVAELLKARGVESALVSLGGNVVAVGGKPDGTEWKIAVLNPFDTDERIGIVKVRDMSVITSGGYQRYFEEGGRRYHHIINPETGYPAEAGLASVTIVCADGTKADVLSTALFVLGLERALEIWRESDDFDVIFVTEDAEIIVTEGIVEAFSFEGSGKEFTYEIAKR